MKENAKIKNDPRKREEESVDGRWKKFFKEERKQNKFKGRKVFKKQNCLRIKDGNRDI